MTGVPRRVYEVTAVPRGREDELREVLDTGDPYAVLDWLAEAEYLG